MSLPWFLELLALPPHADERAVRRAYAARIKAIDPAIDAAGFARLREAYEAARAWAADEDHAILEELSPSTSRDEQGAALTDGVADQAPMQPGMAAVNSQEQAARLVDRFAERIGPGMVLDIRAELEACTAELRLQYIDAPGMFEEVLIDRLAKGDIERRARVFTLASEHFHWQEIGHVASLGPKGRWIEAVESQRMAWDGLPSHACSRRLSLIERVAATKGDLPNEIARRWIDVREDFRRFPAYLGLYLAPLRQLEWAACYGALPAAQRQALEAPAKPRRWRWPSRDAMYRAWGFLFIALVGGLIYVLESAAPIPTADGPASLASLHAAAGRASGLAVVVRESSGPTGKGWIEVTLTNHGHATVYLAKSRTPPMTPGERLASPLFTVIDRHGMPMSFLHRDVPMEPVEADDPDTFYLRLEPGQTLSNRIDLGSYYDLAPGASYLVAYRQPVTRSVRFDAHGRPQDEGGYVDSIALSMTAGGPGDRVTEKAAAPRADRVPRPP